MNLKTQFITITVVCSILVALLLGEITIRLVGHHNSDGNFSIGQRQLYPYHLPINKLKNTLNQYLSSNNSIMVYDPLLGWDARPNNEDTSRTRSSETIISKEPKAKVLKIALLGDSFTGSIDSPYKSSWGYYLENNLKATGINAQVLNFGMDGYGMDQSFLRWKKIRQTYNPHIVIFGLQLENLKRNLNLIRIFYLKDTKIPFSKPRFIIDHDQLKLLNSPTIPPEQIINVVNNLSSWEFIKHEYWYNENDYKNYIFLHSKLISFIYTLIKDHYKEFPTYDQSTVDLAYKIITEFKKDVESTSAKFYVVYLPIQSAFVNTSQQNKKNRNNFLSQLEKTMPLINPEASFQNEIKKSNLKTIIPEHYSAKGNRIVADVISDFILKQKLLNKRESPALKKTSVLPTI